MSENRMIPFSNVHQDFPASDLAKLMKSGNLLSRVSKPGLLLMFAGLGIVLFEIQIGLLRQRLGITGYIIGVLCGTTLSIWGLKEIVAGLLPRIASRGYLFRLPREGLIYLLIMFFLFVSSILTHSNLLMMVFCVMAGAFVVNGWMTFTMLRDARLHREAPERLMAGETCIVTLSLENKHRRLSAWLMKMRDSISFGKENLFPEVLFVRVPPRKTRFGNYQLKPESRGRYTFRHLDLTTQFPFSLVERGVGKELKQEMLVYPRLGTLNPHWRRMLQHSMEFDSYARPIAGTFHDEMNRIREYRPGDDVRMIHWRTTARVNNLMVCEYDESRDRDLVVIVDGWLPPRPKTEELEQLERGLRFAVTLCLSYLRISRQSSLSVFLLGNDTVAWSGDSGEQHTNSLLDSFAVFDHHHRHDSKEVLKSLLQKTKKQCRTIAISYRPEELQSQIREEIPGYGADLQVIGTSQEALSVYFDEQLSEETTGLTRSN
ncbi:DUF58 domain-containing protein [Planctomicrobium sp. SH668]|uniref:DUF58 domain-containing protein n=1 Tax=Planctomicrobium sp. SH668 TaxID=3448126 RepID=UPI003F5AFC1A